MSLNYQRFKMSWMIQPYSHKIARYCLVVDKTHFVVETTNNLIFKLFKIMDWSNHSIYLF